MPIDLNDLPLLLGDVVICPAVAKRQSPTHAGNLEDELALLVVHGILHVLGFDHDKDEQAKYKYGHSRCFTNIGCCNIKGCYVPQ